jgi:hypothetical protein
MSYLNYLKNQNYFDNLRNQFLNEPVEPTITKDICVNCYLPMNEYDGSLICTNCGLTYSGCIFDNIYIEKANNPNTCVYTRLNHFKICLNNFQKKNNININVSELENIYFIFNQINGVCDKYFINRVKMFNYNYLLIKIFEMAKLYDYIKFVKPIKCKKILLAYNNMFDLIIKDLKTV